MGSGCGCLIADFSFVCQTTPHFGSTSRKASYSVWAIIHEIFPFVKPFPDKSFNFYRMPHSNSCHPEQALTLSLPKGKGASRDPFPKEYGFFDFASSMRPSE